MAKVATPVICLGVLFSLVLLPSVKADKVELNSGESFTGKVIRESAEEVIFSHEVAAGISDQKVFPRSEVKKVTKEPEDKAAFEQIKAYKPGADSYAANQYKPLVTALSTFITKFPQSAHLAEAKKNLAALREEQERVEKGELKWNGKWYTEEEVAEHRYQISAHRLLTRMKDLAARNDLIGALNTFDALETNFPGAQAYPDAVDLARKVIASLSPQVERASVAYQLNEKQYEEGLELMVEPKKSQLIEARKAQAAATEAALAAAANQKWTPLITHSGASLEAIKATIATELPRLAALPVAQMRNSVTMAEGAKREIEAKKAEAAEEKLNNAKQLWAANELLARITPNLDALKSELKEKAEEEKKAAEEKEKAKALEAKDPKKGDAAQGGEAAKNA